MVKSKRWTFLSLFGTGLLAARISSSGVGSALTEQSYRFERFVDAGADETFGAVARTNGSAVAAGTVHEGETTNASESSRRLLISEIDSLAKAVETAVVEVPDAISVRDVAPVEDGVFVLGVPDPPSAPLIAYRFDAPDDVTERWSIPRTRETDGPVSSESEVRSFGVARVDDWVVLYWTNQLAEDQFTLVVESCTVDGKRVARRTHDGPEQYRYASSFVRDGALYLLQDDVDDERRLWRVDPETGALETVTTVAAYAITPTDGGYFGVWYADDADDRLVAKTFDDGGTLRGRRTVQVGANVSVTDLVTVGDRVVALGAFRPEGDDVRERRTWLGAFAADGALAWERAFDRRGEPPWIGTSLTAIGEERFILAGRARASDGWLLASDGPPTHSLGLQDETPTDSAVADRRVAPTETATAADVDRIDLPKPNEGTASKEKKKDDPTPAGLLPPALAAGSLSGAALWGAKRRRGSDGNEDER